MVANQINLDAAKKLNTVVARQEVQFYPQLDFQHKPDQQITLLDLTADGEFQRLSHPELMGEILLKSGMGKKVKNLNILVSDISLAKPLFIYADELSHYLRDKGKLMRVHVAGDLNGCSIICPPTMHQLAWQVYAVPAKECLNQTMLDKPDQKRDYQYYATLPNKKILWEGNDIMQWLEDHDRII